MQSLSLYYLHCLDVWCSPITGIPGNVMVTYGPDTEADFVQGTIATFSCTGEGFGFSSGNLERTCGGGTNRIWSGSTPTCEGNLDNDTETVVTMNCLRIREA